jgi:hypothetical protein
MSGTIPLSMTQQFDEFGKPLSGGRLYFFVAGTVSTPQNPFQDTGLTLLHPNPITLDAAGRVPQFFLADGLIKIRLTDSVGAVQLTADNIQVIGASGGGGGGGAIDATTVAQTGDLKPRYGIGSHTGWVRANGRTIGSSVSGASERANADTQALYQYLWGADTSLVVIGGRGASALADFTANKELTLPDIRGRGFYGLDDMGNTPAGRLTAAYFGAAGTTLGAAGGDEKLTLLQAHLPNVTLSMTIPSGQGSHAHSSSDWTGNQSNDSSFGGSSSIIRSGGEVGDATGGAVLPQIGPGNWVSLGGSSTPHSIASSGIAVSIYIKL